MFAACTLKWEYAPGFLPFVTARLKLRQQDGGGEFALTKRYPIRRYLSTSLCLNACRLVPSQITRARPVRRCLTRALRRRTILEPGVAPVALADRSGGLSAILPVDISGGPIASTSGFTAARALAAQGSVLARYGPLRKRVGPISSPFRHVAHAKEGPNSVDSSAQPHRVNA